MMIESDRELSAMVQELWDNDVNRLIPGKDYRISLQVCEMAGARCRDPLSFTAFLLLQGKAGDGAAANNDDNNDGAGSPLFTFVDESIFKKETFLGECAKEECLTLASF